MQCDHGFARQQQLVDEAYRLGFPKQLLRVIGIYRLPRRLVAKKAESEEIRIHQVIVETQPIERGRTRPASAAASSAAPVKAARTQLYPEGFKPKPNAGAGNCLPLTIMDAGSHHLGRAITVTQIRANVAGDLAKNKKEYAKWWDKKAPCAGDVDISTAPCLSTWKRL